MPVRNVGLCAFALTLLLTVAGCQTAPRPEGKDAGADLAAVNALRGRFAAAFNSNDAAALAALYAEDAIEMIANQPAVEGRPAIQSLYQAMFNANSVKIAITPLETHLAGDWAYDRGMATTTITPKSFRPTEESAEYLVILRRLPGGLWKVYREIEVSNNPPPPSPGKKAGRKTVKKTGRKK